MRRGSLLVLTIALGIVTAAAVYSAASVTRYLLSMDAARIRLLNYQISSRVLEERFLAEEMNLDQELQGHILESTVLNFDRFLAVPRFEERAGALMLNAIRFATGKEPLKLEQDEENIRKLQAGFQLERHKRIREAASIFTGLEGRLSGDDRGFILLHSGYCQFLLGKENEARIRLRTVQNEFPGTHFARSAALILAALDARADDPDGLRRADELYKNKRFDDAAKLYAKAERLSPEQAYRYARSLEETGRIREATALYRRLSETAPAVQIPSVRRLLVLGVFLDAGPEVAEYARQRSRELKDNAADQVDQARSITADIRVLGQASPPSIQSMAREAPAVESAPAESKAEPAVEIARAPTAAPRAVNPAPQKREAEAAAKQPQKRAPEAVMMILSRDGAMRSASALVIQGSSGVVLPGGAVVKLDDIEIIQATVGTLRLNQADVWTGSLHRKSGGFVTAEKAFIPRDALREVRATH